MKKIQNILIAVVVFGAQISFAHAEIRSASIPLTHTASQNEFKDVQLRAEIWETSSKEGFERKQYEWDEWDCDYNVPAKAGNWHNFFTLPQSDKAEALADSIKGLSLTTAEAIVNSNSDFFRLKPRNWNAFKKEIARIENDLPSEGLYYDVVIISGEDNRRNLGYEKQDGDYNNPPADNNYNPPTHHDNDYNNPGKKDEDYNNPKKKDGDYNNLPSSPTPVQHCQIIHKTEVVWVPYKRSEDKFVDALNKRIDVSFENSSLLSGESEVIHISWDGKSEKVNIDTSEALNSYGEEVDSRGNIYTLKGSGRKAIRPEASDFAASFSNAGGKLVLDVKDNRGDELTKLSDGKYALKVDFKVLKKGSMCHKDTVLATQSTALASGSGRIELNPLMSEPPATGTEYQVVEVSFERQGTIYFSGSSGGNNLGTIKY